MAFTRDELSEGRYNRYLYAIPITANFGTRSIDHVSRVETVVKIPLGLPPLKQGFSDTILKLKSKDSVRDMRAAMKVLARIKLFRKPKPHGRRSVTI